VAADCYGEASFGIQLRPCSWPEAKALWPPRAPGWERLSYTDINTLSQKTGPPGIVFSNNSQSRLNINKGPSGGPRLRKTDLDRTSAERKTKWESEVARCTYIGGVGRSSGTESPADTRDNCVGLDTGASPAQTTPDTDHRWSPSTTTTNAPY